MPSFPDIFPVPTSLDISVLKIEAAAGIRFKKTKRGVELTYISNHSPFFDTALQGVKTFWL
jgi:hypothetical protein